MHQAGVGLAHLADVDVEAAGVVAVGGEGEVVALVAPAAEGVDRPGGAREVVGGPAVAEAVVVAAEAVQEVEPGALVAALVSISRDWPAVKLNPCPRTYICVEPAGRQRTAEALTSTGSTARPWRLASSTSTLGW